MYTHIYIRVYTYIYIYVNTHIYKYIYITQTLECNMTLSVLVGAQLNKANLRDTSFVRTIWREV